MKNKNGITLIALIITIIVLLILAGVSISILTGENGVLTQAQESSEKTKQAKLQELYDLTASSAAMNLEGYTYTDRTGKTVYIPSGFEVSQVTREVGEMKNGKLLVENEVDEGLVIIDKMGDEFVWIPVNSASVFARREGSSNDIGSFSDLKDDYGTDYFIKDEADEISTVVHAKGFFVSRYEIGADGSTQRKLIENDNISYYEKSGFTDATKYWKDARETDTTIGNMKKRQAIIDRILPQLQSKRGIEPVRVISQDECLALANSWKSGKDYQSGLITGKQWDRMVSWICDAGITGPFDDGEHGIDDTTKPGKLYDCKGWGNYRNSLSTTYKLIFTSGDVSAFWLWSERKNWSKSQIGDDYRFVFPTGEFISSDGIDTSKKNMYDVAGNVWEWTTEIPNTNTSNRIIRGGSCDDSGNVRPVTRRNCTLNGQNFTGYNVGFRVVLYVTK